MGATQMIVSRGLEKSHFPLWIFNRPELVVVRLTKCPNESVDPEEALRLFLQGDGIRSQIDL